MNDIEKAMAFLREEQRLRIESSAPVPVPTTGTEPPNQGVEHSSPDGAGAVSKIGTRDVAAANGASVSAVGSLAGASNGFPSTIVRWAAGTGNTGGGNDDPAPTCPDESASGLRRRFDEERFADDVRDGIQKRRDTSVSPARSTGAEDEHALDADRGLPGGTEADADRSVPDMSEPESGAVPSPDGEVSDPDMPDTGTASDPSSSGHESALESSLPDVHASPLPKELVTLPLKQLAERGFLTPGVAKGRLSEEFRRVKRPILRNIADAPVTDGHRNVVMITSSVTGEGKTYTAINLAMSLASERERTVLLVDADVIKGSAGHVLGIDSSRPGLIDVLGDERLDIADVMLATNVPDLRVVPAGRYDEHTTELLSSSRMSDLIDELARRYSDRIIVLDCPPILQTNEANVIADHVGQVIFVVAGQETDQRLVLEAMGRFDESKSVGILLNKASGNSASYGYDYGYS